VEMDSELGFVALRMMKVMRSRSYCPIVVENTRIKRRKVKINGWFFEAGYTYRVEPLIRRGGSKKNDSLY